MSLNFLTLIKELTRPASEVRCVARGCSRVKCHAVLLNLGRVRAQAGPMAPGCPILQLPAEVQDIIAVHMATLDSGIALGARSLLALRLASKQTTTFGVGAFSPPALAALLLSAEGLYLELFWHQDKFRELHEAWASLPSIGSHPRQTLALKRAAGDLQNEATRLLKLWDKVGAHFPDKGSGSKRWADNTERLRFIHDSTARTVSTIRVRIECCQHA